jgi:hypothetical protein
MIGLHRIRAALLVLCASQIAPTDSNAEILVTPRQTSPGAKIQSLAATPHASQVTANLDIAVPKLETLLNQGKYEFTASRTILLFPVDFDVTFGKIGITASGNETYPIRLSAPFTLTGKLQKSKRIPLDESGQASIDVGIDFGTNWCPGVTFSNLNISLNPQIRSASFNQTVGDSSILSSLIRFFVNDELDKNINCQTVTKRIAEVWGSKFLSWSIANKMLFLIADPQAIALSNVKLTDNRLAVTVTLTAATSVSGKEPKKHSRLPATVTKLASPSYTSATPDVDAGFRGDINLNDISVK